MRGVAATQVEVADGVIELVEILLVAVLASHSQQRLNLGLDVGALIDFALLDARVKLRAIFCATRAGNSLKRLVCLYVVAGLCIELPQKELHTRLLRAAAAAHGFCQIGRRLRQPVALNEIVGVGYVVEPTQPLVGQLFFLDARSNVFGFVTPFERAIASQLPDFRLCNEFGQPSEVALDVAERRCRRQEVAFEVLRLAHQPPRIVQKRVILAALEILAIFRVFHLLAVFLRPLLNGV